MFEVDEGRAQQIARVEQKIYEFGRFLLPTVWHLATVTNRLADLAAAVTEARSRGLRLALQFNEVEGDRFDVWLGFTAPDSGARVRPLLALDAVAVKGAENTVEA
jgi:hypothetical protein